MFTRNLKVGKVFSEFIIVVMIDQPILSYFVFGDVKVIVQVRPNTDPVVQVMTDAKLHLAGGRRTQCNGQEIVNTFVKSSLDLAIIIFLCITQ